MRALMAMILVAGTLSACGSNDDPHAPDARAAGFTPPTVISRIDWAARAERRFRRLDTNNDDVLEASELPARAPRLAELDRNKDGEITQIEFNDGMLARFDAMDLNHDQSLTSDEQQEVRGGS